MAEGSAYFNGFQQGVYSDLPADWTVSPGDADAPYPAGYGAPWGVQGQPTECHLRPGAVYADGIGSVRFGHVDDFIGSLMPNCDADATQASPGDYMENSAQPKRPPTPGRPIAAAAKPLPKRRSTVQRKQSSVPSTAAEPDQDGGDSVDGEDAEDDYNDDGTRRRLRRNRAAASRCRRKKKAASEDLAAQESRLEARHTQLTAEATSLRERVLDLKHEILRHAGCDSPLIADYLQSAARRVHDESRYPGPSARRH